MCGNLLAFRVFILSRVVTRTPPAAFPQPGPDLTRATCEMVHAG